MGRTGFVGTSLSAHHIEQIGQALAHVVFLNQDERVVLGQAWLAAKDKLVTCGHVVDQFVSCPSALIVVFPSSGQTFVVDEIRLHPNFVRQADQLVKFDLAVLGVDLAGYESTASPLSFAYEYPCNKDQMLVAIRFPVHLGQLTNAPDPILQKGKLIGQLNRRDSYHLLHDIALAAGDSGTALFAGPHVAAIHCGDTATLPGLNLPTTAIRMAVKVDALREIGLEETASAMFASRTRPLLSAALIFLVCTVFAFVGTLAILSISAGDTWSIDEPAILPIDIRFNEPILGYKLGESVTIDLVPRNNLNLYLFFFDDKNNVYAVQPLPGFTAAVRKDELRTITQMGDRPIFADKSQGKLELVALISNDPLVKDIDWAKANPAQRPLTINVNALMARINDFEKLEPENLLHMTLDAPRAL